MPPSEPDWTSLRGQPFEVPVELGKVREFARATKATNASYLTEVRPVVPPMFLTVAAAWAPREAEVLRLMDLEWSRLLHGAQKYRFTGEPPRAGDTLVAAQQVAKIQTKQGRSAGTMRVIDFLCEFRNPAGELVAEETHTTLVTSAAPAPASAAVAAARPAGDDELTTLLDEPVTMTDIVRYQGASGDLNPIHHDDGVARAAGYPSAFSVGMLHAGILGSYVADGYGPANVREVGVRFRRQVWPGDRLTYGGRVVRRTASTEGPMLELALEVRCNAATVISGTARVLATA